MTCSETAACLFLFAHQDDEYGVFHCLRQSLQDGYEVYCAYLTDGGSQSARRNKESTAVLKKLGVPQNNILYPGSELNLQDGKLHSQYAQALPWIEQWLANRPNVHAVYVPAWEGGHPDHDTLHALAVHAVAKINARIQLMQFPLYNGYRCLGPFFRALHPLPQNGTPVTSKISLRDRIRYLRLCLCYPSQRRAWTGLFPFVFMHYLVWGTQSLQPVSEQRLRQRPHAGALYYERRKFSTWEEINKSLSRLALPVPDDDMQK